VTAATPAPPAWQGTVALVLASSTGGVGQHVRSLARGLLAVGCRVAVYGPAATDQLFGFSAAGADFTAVEIPAGPGPQDSSAIRTLRRALAARDVDVVHAHGLRAALVAALARPRAPLVVTWHNAVLAKGLRGQASVLVERIVARAAALTLGASDDLVARAVAMGARNARLGAVAAPSMAAPRRSRAAVRAEFEVGPRTPLILSVGRLHPQKRYDLLIDVAARWRTLQPPPVTVVAGSGPSYMELAQRASAARADVTLLGHRSDVPDLLAGADLAVVTSDWEARQLFAQEALRAGVPLVATAVGGLPDLVGDAARLVPPNDVDALDAAVRELLADDALRADYAARGPRRAAQWPAEDDTVAAVRAAYAEVTAGQPAPGTRAGRG
jgi:glycosyltransferase involved in cell wall biosynthesis